MTSQEVAVSKFVYGAGAGDHICRKNITTAEVAAFLRANGNTFAEYWTLLHALESTEPRCLFNDDCQIWDALELAVGAVVPTRPASCPRSAAHLNALVGDKACGGCRIPPLSALRCWWPYGLAGLLLGGLGVALIKRRRRDERQRT